MNSDSVDILYVTPLSAVHRVHMGTFKTMIERLIATGVLLHGETAKLAARLNRAGFDNTNEFVKKDLSLSEIEQAVSRMGTGAEFADDRDVLMLTKWFELGSIVAKTRDTRKQQEDGDTVIKTQMTDKQLSDILNKFVELMIDYEVRFNKLEALTRTYEREKLRSELRLIDEQRNDK